MHCRRSCGELLQTPEGSTLQKRLWGTTEGASDGSTFQNNLQEYTIDLAQDVSFDSISWPHANSDARHTTVEAEE